MTVVLPAEQTTAPNTPDQSSALPKERLEYLPTELDSAFYSNLLMNVEDELLDSLFETQYQRENPAPPWLVYAIQKDTTAVPVELVAEQRVTPEGVTQLLTDSVEQVRAPAQLPTTVDSVKVGSPVAVTPATIAMQPLSPDSLRLLQTYRYQMEAERERFKNDLKEQQIRYQYELQLQQVKNELEQERSKAATPNTAYQEAQRQAYLDALSREDGARQQYTATLSLEEAQPQRFDTIRSKTSPLPAVAVAPTTTTTTTRSSNDPQLQRLQDQLTLKEQETLALRQALNAQAKANNSTPVVPKTTPNNKDEQARWETMNNNLQRQQAEIAALRQQLRQQNKGTNTSPTVIPVPVPTDNGEERRVLDELMERETALRLRLENLEKERQAALSVVPTTTTNDTVRIIEQVVDPNAAEKDQLIQELQAQLRSIKDEREAISGTLQEFLNRKNPSYVTKIYFDVARSSLTLQAQENLTSLVAYLQNYPTVNFWVKGYASPTGSKATNDRLSKERAAAVYNYLLRQGVAPERLLQTSYGERNSGLRNELDRRAEVHLSFSN